MQALSPDPILPYLEEVFSLFYRELLSDEHFSPYFKDDRMIRDLIEKQKENFQASLNEDEEHFKKRYVRLGEFHYDRLIPYVDFMKGASFLEEFFAVKAFEAGEKSELLRNIFGLFRKIRAYTAKGYLNRMLDSDRRDIDEFLENINHNNGIDVEIIVSRINWLRQLLVAIENEDRLQAPNLIYEKDSLEDFLDRLRRSDRDGYLYLKNVNKRVYVDAREIFFFLKKGDYQEVLPLYSGIVSIYKSTLILSSSMALSLASMVVSDLKKDALTGLYGRKEFEDIIAAELKMTALNKGRFSLIMLDLDNFKQVNDTYGHLAGDYVLSRASGVIRDNIRSSDFAFRVGGEELAIILRNAGLAQAKGVAENIRRALGEYLFEFESGNPQRITASFGIVEAVPEKNYGRDSLLAAVDEKLYQSKRDGRDRISS